MPYIPPSVVQEVKRMDLLTSLKNYEPYELVHFSGNTYTTRTHDSLKISNGKWMWWSQRTGGRSALDYLIKVRGYSFLEAVELLAERANIQPPLSVSENVPMEKQLLLPKKNQDDQKVIAYLLGRGIDKEIIQFCLESGRVYESAFHHNVVFVGMDEKDNPKYAAIRGTGTSFIGEANGSDKNYSFSIFTERSCDTVHLFESAIDLLSYATLQKLDGKEWRREHLLSLAGVYQPAKEIEKSKVPAALARTLKMHPEVKTIVLHLDNDRIGRLATKAISTVLPKQYQIKDVPPKQGKDYNDLLCIKLNLAITKREKSMKKMIGKIALSFLLVFAGLCLGETVAGLKSYEGDLASFVLSSLQADILFLSVVIVFLILSILSRQKEILNHQKEQLEASRELQMLLKRREEELFTKKPAENNSTPDASDHTERQEKRDES